MPSVVVPSSYLLSDSGSETERLRLQARFWESDARDLMARTGLAEGSRVLDVGCGAMGVLRVLSRAVGPTGEVVGLDLDPRLLSAAQRWADFQGLDNIELLEADAFNTGLRSESFDLVHARFMFCPLGNSPALLREMVRLTRPGGIIAIEEPIAATWRFFGGNETWRRKGNRLIEIVTRAFRQGGGDFDAGRHSLSLLGGAGVTEISARRVIHSLSAGHPYRRLPVQFATSLRQRIADHGLAGENELRELMHAAERIALDDDTTATTFTLSQVWGRKA